jgi:Ca2+-binding RTX toxin-like protein
VIFGRPPDSPRTRIGSAGSQTISGGAFADTVKGLDGNDGLEGRGGADNLIGGAKSDTASYLHAPAGVIASLENPAINTGDAAGDSYTTVENLTGSRFDDQLIGNGDANLLTGSAGPDVETGGGGKDTFVLNVASDSPSGAGRDQITDFDAGTAASSVDKIDVSAIDAKTGPGNQAFTWIGKAAFTHTKGALRVGRAGSSAIVMGDVNGDAVADFKIELLNLTDLSTLTAIDFIL